MKRERKIEIIKREKTIIIEDPNPRLNSRGVKKILEEKFPIIEDSEIKEILDDDYRVKKIEFIPYSEIPLKEIHNLILSDDFGNVPLIKDYLENLTPLSPYQKIISILNHLIEIEPQRIIYSRARKILLFHLRKLDKSNEEEEIELPHCLIDLDFLIENNNPLLNYDYQTIFELHGKCWEFACVHFYNIKEILNNALNFFYESKLMVNYRVLINEKLPVISNDDEIFIMSIMLFDFDTWKEIILHEIRIIESKVLKQLTKNRFISLLEQLEHNINYKKVPDFHQNYLELECHGIENMFYIMDIVTKQNFKNSIRKHINFISSIKENAFEQTKKLTLNRADRDKILLNKSPIKFHEILKLFFIKNGVKLSEDRENRIKGFIKNCFIYDKKYSFSSSSINTINFFNSKLRERFLILLYILNQEGFIKYKSSRQLYNLLIDELKATNDENTGFSESTLKPLFKDLNSKNKLIYNIAKQSGFNSLSELRAIIN